MIQDGLVLALNAADRNSYVSGSTTWRDLSISRDDAILTNISNINQSLSLITGSSTIDITDLINDSFLSSNKNITVFFVSKQKQPLTSVSVSTFDNTYIYNLNQENIQFNIYTFTFQQQDSNIILNGYLNTDSIIAQNTTITSTMLGSSYNITIKTTNNPNPAYISQIYVYNRILQQSEIIQNYNVIKSRFGL